MHYTLSLAEKQDKSDSTNNVSSAKLGLLHMVWIFSGDTRYLITVQEETFMSRMYCTCHCCDTLLRSINITTAAVSNGYLG